MANLICLSVWLAGLINAALPVDASNAKQDIASFLRQHCVACHGPTENRVVPELNVLDVAQLEKQSYLVPGDTTNSQIWERVQKGEMPPNRPVSQEAKGELELAIQLSRQPRDIVSTLKADRRLESAVRLAETAGMIALLKSPGPFTILAPTDSAFDRLSPANRKALEREAKSLLYNHGILGSYSTEDLLKSGRVISALMCPLTVRRMQDGQIWIGDQNALVEVANIRCTNGMIHLIDRVLIPPGLVLPGREPFLTKAGVEMIHIDGGKFVMGAPPRNLLTQHESPQRQVQVPSLYVATHEITWEQYRFVMEGDPVEKIWIRIPPADQDPVGMVSWVQAVKFCNEMSKLEGLILYYSVVENGEEVTVKVQDLDGEGFRLPTEAEWEYACRGGSPDDYCFGGDETLLGGYAWFLENTTEARSVRGRKPNSFGLFDMHGNVAEWCQDWYAEYQAAQDGQVLLNPQGPTTGTMKVYRGGSHVRPAEDCRSAWRACAGLSFKHPGIGFRVVRTLKRGEPDPRFVPRVR